MFIIYGNSMEKVKVSQKFSLFSDHWNPRIIAELNGQVVRVAKVQGEFIWHKHDHEDELFWIHKGELKMEFRDRTIILQEGEMLVVPKGVEHRPVAEEEVELILFEPIATVNTGEVVNDRTADNSNKV